MATTKGKKAVDKVVDTSVNDQVQPEIVVPDIADNAEVWIEALGSVHMKAGEKHLVSGATAKLFIQKRLAKLAD